MWLRLARHRWLLLGGSLLVLLGFGLPWATRLLTARAFLDTLSGGETRGAVEKIVEQEVWIPSAQGPVRARSYRPSAGRAARGVVVAHGVHYRGIEERRLVAFARALARTGVAVLTPELVDLADYRLTPASVETIASSVEYLTARRDWVQSERVGLIGFSFAGGLALVAAGQARLSSRLEYVMSVGGHHSVERVFHFLLTSRVETPNGVAPFKAHDYGLAVILYGYLQEFLQEPELGPTRDAFRAWLQERPREARVCAASLGGEGARLFHLLETKKLSDLSPKLEAILAEHRGELLSLSPVGKLSKIQAPVYLLHGSLDSVIPASESEFAALELGQQPHEVLLTPLIEHVEVRGAAGLGQQLSLLAFIAHLF